MRAQWKKKGQPAQRPHRPVGAHRTDPEHGRAQSGLAPGARLPHPTLRQPRRSFHEPCLPPPLSRHLSHRRGRRRLLPDRQRRQRYFDGSGGAAVSCLGHSNARVAQELEDEILTLGPDTVMAFIAEPVVGATLGAVPPVPGYFRRIREICDRYGVLLILDEVMCGMGRTGHLFACEAEGVAPDILCIAKGLGAGYQPVGAMLCSSAIYEAIAGGSGFFQHGHTYVGHPTACAAGLAVVQEMLEHDLPAQVRARGGYFEQALTDRFGQHPHVGDIRGRGLFRGLEFVADREGKTPFEPGDGLAGKLKKAAFDEGLICYPMSGTRDGRHGDHVLLAPPFIASESELDGAVDALDRALTRVLAEVA